MQSLKSKLLFHIFIYVCLVCVLPVLLMGRVRSAVQAPSVSIDCHTAVISQKAASLTQALRIELKTTTLQRQVPLATSSSTAATPEGWRARLIS